MDVQTKDSLTKGLDTAIVTTAKAELGRLSKGLDPCEIANQICGALRSLKRLQSGKMPEYNEWDALFYLLWYQPDRINLAYSLIRIIRNEYKIPLVNEDGFAEVSDFGCGELAMQFGLAMAAADPSIEVPISRKVSIISSDVSSHMETLGWKLWCNFIIEIMNEEKYPQLQLLNEVSKRLSYGSSQDPNTCRWLTALHVAYEENYKQVRKQLDAEVSRINPDLLLVSTQQQSAQWLYNPRCTYSNYRPYYADIHNGNLLDFQGVLPLTSRYRKRIYYKHVCNVLSTLSECDASLADSYLTYRCTSWITSASQYAKCIIYTRK